MQGVRAIFRQNLRQWRHFSKSACVSPSAEAQAAAASSNQPLPPPPPSGADRPLSPKLEKLVTEISGLNLIEVSELSSALKKRLNLPDAPVMPMGGFFAGTSAKGDDADEEAAPKAVKTSFTVKMTAFDDKQKIGLIKEIKNLMDGMNLVQAKKFVESVPTVVKADIGKEEAEKLKEALVKAGATVEID